MSRLPRFVLPGQPQHVIQRGNNSHIIFVVEEDYQYYLSKLIEACEKHRCDIHAYVLMTNHVHLLITPYVGNGISKVMQSVGRYYVQYFNRRYQRTGTLWEGRYKATLLNSDQYFLVCSRYIELNPVRAGMVKSPEDYRWSSYRGNALNDDDPLLTNHCLYRSLGRDDKERCRNYRALFDQHLSSKEIDTIREATNKAWALGNDRFRDEIEQLTKRQASPKPRGGKRQKKSNRV